VSINSFNPLYYAACGNPHTEVLLSTVFYTTLRLSVGLCEIEAEVGLGGKHADAYTTRIALRTVTSHAFHRFGFSSISFCCHLETVVRINGHCHQSSLASYFTYAVRDQQIETGRACFCTLHCAKCVAKWRPWLLFWVSYPLLFLSDPVFQCSGGRVVLNR
jgi:hypothetical protein